MDINIAKLMHVDNDSNIEQKLFQRIFWESWDSTIWREKKIVHINRWWKLSIRTKYLWILPTMYLFWSIIICYMELSNIKMDDNNKKWWDWDKKKSIYWMMTQAKLQMYTHTHTHTLTYIQLHAVNQIYIIIHTYMIIYFGVSKLMY